MKARAFCLAVRGFVSRTIRETLALYTQESLRRTFSIGHAKLGAIVVTEIKFRQIALQMGFADVVIDAIDATLENREVTFDRIAVRVVADVFTIAMVNHLVTGEFLANAHVTASGIRHQR